MKTSFVFIFMLCTGLSIAQNNVHIDVARVKKNIREDLSYLQRLKANHSPKYLFTDLRTLSEMYALIGEEDSAYYFLKKAFDIKIEVLTQDNIFTNPTKILQNGKHC